MPEQAIPDELIENMMRLSEEAEGIEYPTYDYEPRERGLGEKIAPIAAALSMMIRHQSPSRRTRAEALPGFQRTLDYLRQLRLQADVQHERAAGQEYRVATGEAMFKANRIQQAFQRNLQLMRLQESMQGDVSDKDEFLAEIMDMPVSDIGPAIKSGKISETKFRAYAPSGLVKKVLPGEEKTAYEEAIEDYGDDPSKWTLPVQKKIFGDRWVDPQHAGEIFRRFKNKTEAIENLKKQFKTGWEIPQPKGLGGGRSTLTGTPPERRTIQTMDWNNYEYWLNVINQVWPEKEEKEASSFEKMVEGKK